MIASQDSLPKTIEVIAQERGLFRFLRFLLIMFPRGSIVLETAKGKIGVVNVQGRTGEDLFGDPMINVSITVSGIFPYELLRVIRESL